MTLDIKTIEILQLASIFLGFSLVILMIIVMFKLFKRSK